MRWAKLVTNEGVIYTRDEKLGEFEVSIRVHRLPGEPIFPWCVDVNGECGATYPTSIKARHAGDHIILTALGLHTQA